MRFLTVPEINALAKAMDPRYRSVVLVGCWGGLRMSELLGLKPERVDITTGRVRITENLVESEGHLYTETCKTRASVRSVTLPMVARVALEDTNMGEYVWEAPKGGPVRLSSWRSRYWYPAVERSGIQRARPHDMRHTAAALMIASGAKSLEISRRLGHSSVAFTLDVYGHLFEGYEDQLNAGLDRLAEIGDG
jgi:integrase